MRGGKENGRKKIYMVKMGETKHSLDRQIEKRADGQTE